MIPLTPSERKLNQLFNSLEVASRQKAIEQIQDCIWNVWSSSGCSKIDFALGKASEASEEGDHSKALRIFTSIIGFEPSFSEAYVRRADVFLKMGLYKKALLDFKKALKIEPRRFDAMYGAAHIYLTLNYSLGAFKMLRQVQDLIPNESELNQNMEFLKKQVRA